MRGLFWFAVFGGPRSCFATHHQAQAKAKAKPNPYSLGDWATYKDELAAPACEECTRKHVSETDLGVLGKLPRHTLIHQEVGDDVEPDVLESEVGKGNFCFALFHSQPALTSSVNLVTHARTATATHSRLLVTNPLLFLNGMFGN